MSTKAIERVKAHYKKLAGEPVEIAVPEWADEGGTFFVYATPLTLYERSRISRLAKDKFEQTAEVLILKARDKDGNALFTKEDKPDLMRTSDSSVVARVAQAIVDINDDDVDLETDDAKAVEVAEGN